MNRPLAPLIALFAAACTVNVQQPSPPPITPPRQNPAAHLTPADIGELPPLGATYTGSIPMLNRVLPLPNGVWKVVVQQRNTFAGHPPGALVMLLRTDGRQMTGALEISGNAIGHPAAAGWPLSATCQNAARLGANSSILAADTGLAEPGGDQDCVVVGFMNTARWRSATPDMQAVARTLDALGIVPPPIAVVAAIGQANPQYRLLEQLWLNPDLAGIAPDPEPRPLLNAWAYTSLRTDPARQAYVTRIMAWAQSWRPVVRLSLTDPAAVAPGVAEIQ